MGAGDRGLAERYAAIVRGRGMGKPGEKAARSKGCGQPVRQDLVDQTAPAKHNIGPITMHGGVADPFGKPFDQRSVEERGAFGRRQAGLQQTAEQWPEIQDAVFDAEARGKVFGRPAQGLQLHGGLTLVALSVAYAEERRGGVKQPAEARGRWMSVVR